MTPKLPKELQKKKKAQQSRIRGPAKKSSAASSRAMRRQMQKQGIDNVDQLEATRVIIQTADKQYVIENPQVMKMIQGGMTIHQVVGEAEEHDISEVLTTINSNESDDGYVEETPVDEGNDEGSDGAEGLTINEQDIILVAAQAGVTQEVAKSALEDAEGDLARAILSLKTR